MHESSPGAIGGGKQSEQGFGEPTPDGQKWQEHKFSRKGPDNAGENPPYGMTGGMVETSASLEARYAPLSYPTAGGR
ncbi:MAG: hypothetical protein WBQ89_09130 [Candidatus Acidiferrum sp.]